MPAIIPNSKPLRVTHHGWNQIQFPDMVKDEADEFAFRTIDGKPVVFGSKQDNGVLGARHPMLEIDRAMWERAKKAIPDLKAYVEKGTLAESYAT